MNHMKTLIKINQLRKKTVKKIYKRYTEDPLTPNTLPPPCRFTLKGSNVSGVLTQDTWGNLTFHQVVIEGNQITQVDNKAFAKSAETLTFLSLCKFFF